MTKQPEPVYNTAGTHVFTTSPTGDEWECPVDYLPVALARGFELAEPRDTSLDGLFDEDAPAPKKRAASKTPDGE